MINLLRDDTSRAELVARFAAHVPCPLLPPSGAAEWEAVRQNPLARPWCDAVRAAARADAAEPRPECTDALYADFLQTGRRKPFEDVYFARRRRLGRAVLACVLETDAAARAECVGMAIDEIRAVGSEPSWSLPAHVKNASGKDPMHIDLFAAETANLFAEVADLLPADLPADLLARIDERLQTQIFTNYRDRPFWWFDNNGNWNAVCHQGVLGAALARVRDPDLLADLFFAAAPRLRIFLSGFGDDGSTSEGPAYWNYGFGRFAELGRQLERRTAGALSLTAGDPRVAAIARFGPAMTLSNGYCVNFADCAPQRAVQPPLLTTLAELLNDASIARHAAAEWARAAAQPVTLGGQRDDLFHLTRRLLSMPASVAADTAPEPSDTLWEGIGVVVARFRDDAGHWWEFAAKAGHNDEMHNHNDVGSYLLNIDGRRVVVEIGAPEYTRAFFGPGRYGFLAARSAGHAVPLINGQEQCVGRGFAGSVTAHSFSAAALSVAIDVTHAYPAAAHCVRCVRHFDLDKRSGTLRVRDEFVFDNDDGTADTPLIVDARVVRNGDDVCVDAGVRVRITPLSGSRFGKMAVHPFNDHEARPTSVTRIAVVPPAAGRHSVIGYTVAIAGGAQA